MCHVHIPSAGVSVCAVQTGILSPDSTYSRDPGRPLSATTALNNRSVFAAVCTKRTGKDRHLLLTTNAGRGGEIQSLTSGWVGRGGSVVYVEGRWDGGGCLTTTPFPLGASSSHS